MGRGRGGGGGGQDESGLSLPLSHREWTVLLTDDKNAHKPLDRSIWSLAAVWHPTNKAGAQTIIYKALK